VASAPEIPVVRVPVRGEDVSLDGIASGVSVSAWAPIEVPRRQGLSSTVLAALGVMAGIGAMVLGAFAVYSAGSSPGASKTAAPASADANRPIEGRVLSLLAKPSTERVVFRGSEGRLVLAIGSGGRAAILIRGFRRPAAAKPLYAWVLAPSAAPVRAARFVASDRAVFLSVPVGPRASVIVSSARPTGRTVRSSVIASRS
jgi:hypothetical protein